MRHKTCCLGFHHHSLSASWTSLNRSYLIYHCYARRKLEDIEREGTQACIYGAEEVASGGEFAGEEELGWSCP